MTRAALLLLLAAPVPAVAQRLPDPQVADLFAAGPDATLVLAQDAPAATVTVTITVTLRWSPGPASVALSDGDVVARYTRAPDEAAIAAFATAAGGRVARFDWGPDNLVIRAARGHHLSAAATPDGLAVTFTADPDAAADPTPAAPDDGRTAALLLAQADAAAGYPGRARRQVAALAAARLGDPALQAALASAEVASGRTRDGARRYARLPDRGGAPGEAAARTVGPAVETTLLVRDGDGFGQSELALRGGAPLDETVRIDGGVRHLRSHGTDPSGADRRLRTRATEAGIAATVEPVAGLRLRFDLTGLVDSRGVGAAAAAAIGDPERRGAIRIGWHLPDFATPTGALYRGWTDRATAGGVLRIAPGATVRADASLARYGLYGEGMRAGLTTAALDGGVDYLLRRQSPSLLLGYRIDAEYVLDRVADAGPDPYAAFTDRENHTAEATIAQPLGNRLVLTGAGGWTVNRYGGDGPTAALGLALVPTDGWEGNLLGGISSIARAGQPDRQLYGRAALTRRFGGRP